MHHWVEHLRLGNSLRDVDVMLRPLVEIFLCLVIFAIVSVNQLIQHHGLLNASSKRSLKPDHTLVDRLESAHAGKVAASGEFLLFICSVFKDLLVHESLVLEVRALVKHSLRVEGTPLVLIAYVAADWHSRKDVACYCLNGTEKVLYYLVALLRYLPNDFLVDKLSYVC